MIIPDCDETYNYWDPLNLLLRGFGKQTWEYSPEFAIRSYGYLLPYYILTLPVKYLQETLNWPSYVQFYFVRSVLTGFTVYSEYQLYKSLKSIDACVGKWYMFLTTISTGMAHASVALLPSSFALQCMTLSVAYSLKKPSVSNTVKALTWIMIGGIVGWPFVLALAVPFGIMTLIQRTKLPQIIIKSAINLITILLIIITIDSFYYKRLVLIPLNIVLYNVFGQEGEGPEIFGIEPFSYYVQNLLLNFNIIGVLGYLNVINIRFNRVWFVINGPLIIWSIIFGTQPHKEERFLYPIYSLILVNAAFIISDIFKGLEAIITKKLIQLAKLALMVAISVVSILRTMNLVENYSAPLTISKELATNSLNHSGIIINVCVGREWYHFPNSFFLPDNHRLRFVKSGFDGLLPGDFIEQGSIFEQTSHIPQGMNNKNLFSDLTVIPFEQCDYYLDNSGKTNGFEPDIFSIDNWKVIKCQPLINPDGNHGIGRLIYVPQSLRGYVPYNVEYMDFCLLEKESKN